MSRLRLPSQWTRLHSSKAHASSPRPIISIPPGSSIYPFGAPSQTRTPLLAHLAWTVREGEAWAVVSGTGAGGAGKGAIFKALLGQNRVAAPTPELQGRWAEAGGLYPFLSSPSAPSSPSPSSASVIDPYTRISFVSFRQRSGGSDGGAFFDYTARYGAIRDEADKVTLRNTLMGAAGAGSEKGGEHELALFEELTARMGLKTLLDLPMVTLSNGQTRRARVVQAILGRPEVLVLDEPLTGLDAHSRIALTETLHQLHDARSPRVIIGLRKGEEVPAWITHVLEVEGGTARARKASEFTSEFASAAFLPAQVGYGAGKDNMKMMEKESTQSQGAGALLVDMRGVNVVYGDRKVLTNINWQIRQGERWHLQGANGTGKTTLLSLLTGDHPQSYTQAHLLLPSLASPSQAEIQSDNTPSLQHRKRTPTAHLRQLIGVVSPEMVDAFPRKHPGMSVWEAVSTGFDGGFVPRTKGASGEERKEGGAGWVDVGDDELGLRWDAGEEEKEARSGEVRRWRVGRVWEVLEALGPAAWSWSPPPPPPTSSSTHTTATATATTTFSTTSSSSSSFYPPSAGTNSFAAQPFSALPPGTQRLVLLARALVGRPPLVLLDEVWSGMDGAQIRAARRYLRGEGGGGAQGGAEGGGGEGKGRGREGVGRDQAVVVVTHWEDEVPWSGGEVRRFSL